MTSTGGGWSAVTASVRGSSHERTGKPNQDSARLLGSKGAHSCLVAAVCDGHGGDRYIRSDVGSRLGTEVACNLAREAASRLGSDATVEAIEDHLAGPLVDAIVLSWRKRVLEHLADHPWTPVEIALLGQALDADPHVSYGCTMVLAVLTSSWVGFVQIGDGDVTLVHQGVVSAPVPGDDRLVGSETTSMCLPTATDDARVLALIHDLPDVVVLTSDGYANSFASDNWRTDTAIDLADNLRSDGFDAVHKRLPGWLAESARVGGDDVTMALVCRTDAVSALPSVAGGGSSMASEGGGSPTAPARAASTGAIGRRPSVVRWILPLLVGFLAGAGLIWLLTGPSDGDEPIRTEPVQEPSSPPTVAQAGDPIDERGGESSPWGSEVELVDGQEILRLEGPGRSVVIRLTTTPEGLAAEGLLLIRSTAEQVDQVVPGWPWSLDQEGHLILNGNQLDEPLIPEAFLWDADSATMWVFDGQDLLRFAMDGGRECIPLGSGVCGTSVDRDSDGSGVGGVGGGDSGSGGDSGEDEQDPGIGDVPDRDHGNGG